jgi:hypothetical protein
MFLCGLFILRQIKLLILINKSKFIDQKCYKNDCLEDEEHEEKEEDQEDRAIKPKMARGMNR